MATNRFPGVCEVCGARVPAGTGAYLKVDNRPTVLCAEHGPRQEAASIRVAVVGGELHISPVGHLGPVLFARYRAALDGTARWTKAKGANVAPLSALGLLLSRLTEAGLAVERDAEVAALAQRLDDQAHVEVAAATDRAAAVDITLRAQGKHLFPFQADGVAWLARMHGAVLADEMGLGKTIQVLVAAPAGAPILVVCPKVAKGVWRRETACWRPDLTVVVLEGRGSFRLPTPGELVVTNYDLLPPAPMTPAELGEAQAKLSVLNMRAASASASGSELSAVDAKTLATLRAEIGEDARVREMLATAPAGFVVVADEAHMLKGSVRKVNRAASFRAIAERARAVDGRSWLVTGSPMLNDPPELWNLLRIVGMTGAVFGTYDDFLRLMGGYRAKFGIRWGGRDAIDPSVPGLLQRAMLRRLKREVARQLPAKVVEIVDVDLDDVGKRDSKELAQAVAYLESLGIRPGALIDAAQAARKIDFTTLSRAREILAMAKLPAALELVEQLEAAGRPVLVGSAHVGPVRAFADRPGWAVITGDTSDEDRTRIAAQFQAGELRGVAGTIQAMGVAITLTRGADGIAIDPVWTPDLNRQWEDRLHRLGQEQSVGIRYFRAAHPIDALVYAICDVKAGVIGATVDAAAVAEAPAAGPGVAELLAAASEGNTDDARASAAEVAAEIQRLRALRATAEGERTAREQCLDRVRRAAKSRGFVEVGEGTLATERRAPRGPRETWAAQAICQLAGQCDGAQTEDEVGFMKSDVALGHSLAAHVADGLTDGEWHVAVRVALRYPAQVGRPVLEARTRCVFVFTRRERHGAQWSANLQGADERPLFDEHEAGEVRATALVSKRTFTVEAVG